MLKRYLFTFALCLPLFFSALAVHAQTMPEACADGELLSLESPGNDHAVAPGCYTQEAADTWCDTNYMTNTTASADGDSLFCNCIGPGYMYDSATQSCVNDSEGEPVLKEAETCAEGEVFTGGEDITYNSLTILEPGCYTQETADIWCAQNYKANSSVGDILIDKNIVCLCAEGYVDDIPTGDCMPEGQTTVDITEPCPEGELLSLDWPGKEHIVAPGCYTQEAADAWCETNYMVNTSAGPDGDYLFCHCATGYTYDAATESCLGGAEDAAPVDGQDEDTCQCPKAGSAG